MEADAPRRSGGVPPAVAWASRPCLEFLHFVWELRPRRAPGSRRMTEERFGDYTSK